MVHGVAGSVDLYWIPLGAGGAATVRVSGRIYEATLAVVHKRRPCDLYHSALEVRLDGRRFVVENAWPSPDADVTSRGVVVQGPVWAQRLQRLRLFRYEVRCWPEGTIADASDAVSIQSLTSDPVLADRLLKAVGSVPAHTWGRDVAGIGEMWNSNSVVSYLLTVSGLPADECRPPAGGRAPGWGTGLTLGRSEARALEPRDG